MKYVCKVCGKTIECVMKPLACPLCGVNGDYIVLERDFTGFPQKIDPISLEDLKAALRLEENATADYLKYANECKKVGDIEVATLFEALAKVENGHQIAIRKMMCVK
jgi:rubrerythrin